MENITNEIGEVQFGTKIWEGQRRNRAKRK